MFTYINPEIETPIRDGKLLRINNEGQRSIWPTRPAWPTCQSNGAYPLPLARGNVQPTVRWYASVRSTELTEVEHLASKLREQEGNICFPIGIEHGGEQRTGHRGAGE